MTETDATAGRTFTCAQCGSHFESDWSDEEARAEASAAFAPGELADAAVVCDGCYQALMSWYRPASAS